VIQLLDHTRGNSLHCRALLEELGPGGLARAGQDLPAPQALAGIVLSRPRALPQPAQMLVTAAAVIGRRCPLAATAALAGLADPLAALDQAAAAGLVAEDRAAPGAHIAFTHPLVHAAVRDSLGSAERRRLHRAAVTLVPPAVAPIHRVAAAAGPDDSLADDLEEAALQAAKAGQAGHAAAWLAQASAASTARPTRSAAYSMRWQRWRAAATWPGRWPCGPRSPVQSERPAQRIAPGLRAEIAPEPGPARWGLTASEMAVARLVCTGRSNREVAAELYVSIKAVEYHLGHVFDKVGIRSRKALASRLAPPRQSAQYPGVR
jgi:DNA-binding CsgD family transcriptional regulator